MAKIDIDEVEQVLSQRKVENASAILKDLQAIIDELKAEREAEKEGKPKWEHLVILNDPSGKLIADRTDEVVTAYVVQQEEGCDAGTVISRIRDATVAHNEAAKQRRSRLETLREIFDGLKPKFLKEKKVKIKTKTPVRVLLVQNKL